MQDEGITNPSEQIKKFTREFVEKLLRLHAPQDFLNPAA
jgi:hypothetical protein